MKKFLLSFLLLFFIGSIIAQTEETSDEITKHEGPGKVILLEGGEIEGTITYDEFSGYKLKIQVEGEKKPQKHTTKDVKEFYVNDVHFVRIKGLMLNAFAKVVNEPGSKILLLKTISKATVSNQTDEQGHLIFPVETSYYVLSTVNNKLLFVGALTNKNLSKFVADCPDLSKKIASKEDGYELTIMAPVDKQMEIMKKVMEEYEQCED